MRTRERRLETRVPLKLTYLTTVETAPSRTGHCSLAPSVSPLAHALAGARRTTAPARRRPLPSAMVARADCRGARGRPPLLAPAPGRPRRRSAQAQRRAAPVAAPGHGCRSRHHILEEGRRHISSLICVCALCLAYSAIISFTAGLPLADSILPFEIASSRSSVHRAVAATQSALLTS